jgi:hypothetical protein
MKLNKAIKNETVTPEMQRKFVDSFSKAITGTLIMLIGLILFNMGKLYGADDEKDKDIKAFKKNVMGLNQYSIKLGNNSFTLDWLQPVGGILFSGGAIGKGTEITKPLFDTLLDIASISGNTLFDRSFMSGIQNFFGYDDPMTAITKAVMSAPAQMFSWQIFNQIGQIIDDKARAVYTKEGLLTDVKNNFIARTPIASMSLEPQVDTLGQDIKRYGGKENLVRYLYNVFLNPANVSYKQDIKFADEVYRVYTATGEKGVFPQVAPDSFKRDKIEYTLKGDDKVNFQRKIGQQTVTALNKLTSSSLYKNKNDKNKALELKKTIDDIVDKAKDDYVKFKKKKK